MPSARRRKPESPSQPVLAEAVGAESRSIASQMPHVELPVEDYPRLLLALRDAVPGDLIFVQLNSPMQRRRLPGKLAADGLQRAFAVADFATFRPGPPPDGVLREFLEEVKSTPP